MEVKGSAVVAIPIFIKDKFGEEGYQRWLAELSPPAREVYGSAVMVSSWYSVKEIFIEPSKKMCELFYQGDAKGAWEAGRFSAEHGLKGLYRIFVKLGSPEFIVSRASHILPMYYRPCEMKLVEHAKGRAVIHIPLFPEPHHLLEVRIAGWMERAIELSGGKEIGVKITKSLAKGDPYSEFLVSWK